MPKSKRPDPDGSPLLDAPAGDTAVADPPAEPTADAGIDTTGGVSPPLPDLGEIDQFSEPFLAWEMAAEDARAEGRPEPPPPAGLPRLAPPAAAGEEEPAAAAPPHRAGWDSYAQAHWAIAFRSDARTPPFQVQAAGHQLRVTFAFDGKGRDGTLPGLTRMSELVIDPVEALVVRQSSFGR